MYHRLIFFLFTVLLSSCATMHHGSKQTVHLNSIPQGAEVRINDSLMGITPLTLKVKRIKRLTITYTHPDFETRVFQAPRTFIRKRLMADFPFWFLGFNPFLFTDLVTGAAFEFDQTKLNPDLSDNSLFIKKSIPKITTPEDSIELAKIATLNKKTKDSLYAIKVKMREEIRLAEIAQIDAERKLQYTQDSVLAVQKAERSIQKRELRMYVRTNLRNTISIQPLQLLTRTIQLSYTRQINSRLALGAVLGYMIPLGFSSKEYTNNNGLNINGPVDAMMFMPFTEGKYLSIFTKFYFDKTTFLNMFASLAYFYRDYSYEHATIKWEDQSGGSKGLIKNYVDELDARQEHKGFKFLAGINPMFRLGSKMALELEASIGFSVRKISTNLYHYNYSYHYSGNTGSYSVPTGEVIIAQNKTEKYDAINQVLPLFELKVGFRF